MIYYLIDFLCLNICNLNINLYLYGLQNIKLIDFILTLIVILLISNDILLITMFIFIFIINKIIYKYLNNRLLIKLILYTFEYLIIFEDIKLSFFLNLLLVIIIEFYKYNNIGDKSAFKKTNLKYVN